MTRPFGKPVHHGWSLTRGVRLSIALWGAAIPAYLLCAGESKAYPTVADRPFFWPAAVVLTLFYALTLALWLKRRPSPRPPGASSSTGLFISRFLVALLLAFPAGLVTSFLYGPALALANGLGSHGAPTVEHALVDRQASGWVLDSPYWEPGFRWPIANSSSLPKDLAPGSLARLKVRRGLLGARWVESVEYVVLP